MLVKGATGRYTGPKSWTSLMLLYIWSTMKSALKVPCHDGCKPLNKSFMRHVNFQNQCLFIFKWNHRHKNALLFSSHCFWKETWRSHKHHYIRNPCPEIGSLGHINEVHLKVLQWAYKPRPTWNHRKLFEKMTEDWNSSCFAAQMTHKSGLWAPYSSHL